MSSRRLRFVAVIVLLAALVAASGCRELLGPSEEPAFPEVDSNVDPGPVDEPRPMGPVPPRHGLLDAKKKNLVTIDSVEI